HFPFGKPQGLGVFGYRWIASQVLPKALADLGHLDHALAHVRRDAHGAVLIRQRAVDGLAYPPSRVRRKLESASYVELLGSLDEPKASLLNKVDKVHAG